MISAALLLVLAGCADKASPEPGLTGDSGNATTDGGSTTTPPVVLPPEVALTVQVTLDGSPASDVVVTQGGSLARWTTDAAGVAEITFDTTVQGSAVVMASHHDARIVGIDVDDELEAGGGTISLALSTFDTSDNEAYEFQDPGEPHRRDTTGQCAHCHMTINTDWDGSAHRQSASNTVVQDLYAGAAAAFADEDSCESAGGQWWTGITPGTAVAGERCYLGLGALPTLNEDCGDTGPCDGVAENTGECADCHAPGIDGELGGRDLLEATELAYDYGVHCDVCHKVDDVVIADPDPGVAGRLRILRPTEEATIASVGEWDPLTFGPYPDVINPRMGSVQRDIFSEPGFCAGCHQHDQLVMVPGASLDDSRWPEGRLPVHSTFKEWLAGPFAGDADPAEGGGAGAPCQSCHMPAASDVGNSANLGNVLELEPGIAAGWYRQPGEVRRHAWYGPRHSEQRMLDLAASLNLEATRDEGAVTVLATVKNVGPGHALPTGEPLRHMLVLVTASCDGITMPATGGDAVNDVGGYLDRKERGEDWSVWPGAEVGDVLRVVSLTGAFYDYTGFGPFGDGSFSAEAKGMPVQQVVGQAVVTAVDGDAVTLDAALPDGDIAWRVDGTVMPADGDTPHSWAGAPGFAFARVMVGADGDRMVPHFAAVDIASDNRLLPQESWTSSHSFAACDSGLVVQASLVYRRYPADLAAQRDWSMVDQVMATASVEAR